MCVPCCSKQVRLGDTVTFLPTPLRNWWGRPELQYTWLALSICVIIVMVQQSHHIHASATFVHRNPSSMCTSVLLKAGALSACAIVVMVRLSSSSSLPGGGVPIQNA